MMLFNINTYINKHTYIDIKYYIPWHIVDTHIDYVYSRLYKYY